MPPSPPEPLPPNGSAYDYVIAGRTRRLTRHLVTSRPVAWLSARLLPSLDRAALRMTGGRLLPSAWVTGLPVVALTTTGARSGRPRIALVLGIPVEDGLLVVAANFGQAGNPAWLHNLRAHPRATVVLDARPTELVARELTGREREDAFALALRLNPGWRRFQDRAAPRPIPVLRLTPIV